MNFNTSIFQILDLFLRHVISVIFSSSIKCEATLIISGLIFLRICLQIIKKVAFEPHLPTYELSVGDFIRVGDEYREIGALNQDTTSGNYSWAYGCTCTVTVYPQNAGTRAKCSCRRHGVELLENISSGIQHNFQSYFKNTSKHLISVLILCR